MWLFLSNLDDNRFSSQKVCRRHWRRGPRYRWMPFPPKHPFNPQIYSRCCVSFSLLLPPRHGRIKPHSSLQSCPSHRRPSGGEGGYQVGKAQGRREEVCGSRQRGSSALGQLCQNRKNNCFQSPKSKTPVWGHHKSRMWKAVWDKQKTWSCWLMALNTLLLFFAILNGGKLYLAVSGAPDLCLSLQHQIEVKHKMWDLQIHWFHQRPDIWEFGNLKMRGRSLEACYQEKSLKCHRAGS